MINGGKSFIIIFLFLSDVKITRFLYINSVFLLYLIQNLGLEWIKIQEFL